MIVIVWIVWEIKLFRYPERFWRLQTLIWGTLNIRTSCVLNIVGKESEYADNRSEQSDRLS